MIELHERDERKLRGQTECQHIESGANHHHLPEAFVDRLTCLALDDFLPQNVMGANTGDGEAFGQARSQRRDFLEFDKGRGSKRALPSGATDQAAIDSPRDIGNAARQPSSRVPNAARSRRRASA